MPDNTQKSFLLMARGGSHIRYFTRFKQHSSLNVEVVRINRAFLKPSYLRFWRTISSVDLSSEINTHLYKKRKKMPWLKQQPVRWIFNSAVRLNMKLQLVKYCGLIDAHCCDVVGVWNGQKMPSRGIELAANLMKKEVVHFENGLLPDSTTCDWQGVNCHNSLPRTPGFYHQFAHQQAKLPTQLLPRAAKGSKGKGVEKEALPRHYVFVPFQVETDSQIVSNSPWIKSMAQLHRHLCDAIDKVDDPRLHIVVKEHPSEVTRYDHLHNVHAKVVFANQCSTQDLIEGAAAVLTINSTVGIESLLLGKLVMVLGEACYAIDGVSHHVADEAALVRALQQVDTLATDEISRSGFLHFLHEHYVIPQSWKRAEQVHFDALTQRLLKADSFSQLTEGVTENSA